MEKLALLGGTPVFKESAPQELFKWPIITDEDKKAVMEVVETNNFSGLDITTKFQDEFAVWQGRACFDIILNFERTKTKC